MQAQTVLFVFFFLVHSKYAVISHYYYAPLEERIILISVSAGLFVCVFVSPFASIISRTTRLIFIKFHVHVSGSVLLWLRCYVMER